MNSLTNKIRRFFFLSPEDNRVPPRITGWGNSYNDIYILKLVLIFRRNRSVNGIENRMAGRY